MIARHLVVPVRGDDERLGPVDAPAEHAEHVERGAVRPVHVLQDDDAAAFQQRSGKRARLGRLEAEIEERPKRARRGEVLARPAYHAADARRESTDKRRLADTRLAAEEDHPAAFSAGALELREQISSLEQLGHGETAS